MAQTFTRLKKILSVDEFNELCRKVALEYADSVEYYSADYFCKRYDITKSCFQKMIDYAIVNNLISDNTVNRMMNKAIANQRRHCKTAGITTIEKYARLQNERTENFQREIAIFFVNNPDKTKKELARIKGLTIKEFDWNLVRAIEDNVVSDEIVDSIEERSIKNAKPGTEENTKVFFEGMRKKREANKKGVALN